MLLASLGGVDGAIAGAAWEGVLGALVGTCVAKEHLFKYEDHVKAGKYLVIAHGSGEEMQRARDILWGTAATDVHSHAESTS